MHPFEPAHRAARHDACSIEVTERRVASPSPPSVPEYWQWREQGDDIDT